MKKLGLLIVALLFLALIANAQIDSKIKVGVNAGLPLGDVKDYSSFNLSVDAAYLFEVADMVYAGPLVSYSHYFAKEFQGYKIKDVQHIPIAASARINFGFDTTAFLGADIGYAIGVSDGTDGGIFYRPKLGYDFGGVAAVLAYTGIGEDTTLNSLTLGV